MPRGPADLTLLNAARPHIRGCLGFRKGFASELSQLFSQTGVGHHVLSQHVPDLVELVRLHVPVHESEGLLHTLLDVCLDAELAASYLFERGTHLGSDRPKGGSTAFGNVGHRPSAYTVWSARGRSIDANVISVLRHPCPVSAEHGIREQARLHDFPNAPELVRRELTHQRRHG